MLGKLNFTVDFNRDAMTRISEGAIWLRRFPNASFCSFAVDGARFRKPLCRITRTTEPTWSCSYAELRN